MNDSILVWRWSIIGRPTDGRRLRRRINFQVPEYAYARAAAVAKKEEHHSKAQRHVRKQGKKMKESVAAAAACCCFRSRLMLNAVMGYF